MVLGAAGDGQLVWHVPDSRRYTCDFKLALLQVIRPGDGVLARLPLDVVLEIAALLLPATFARTCRRGISAVAALAARHPARIPVRSVFGVVRTLLQAVGPVGSSTGEGAEGWLQVGPGMLQVLRGATTRSDTDALDVAAATYGAQHSGQLSRQQRARWLKRRRTGLYAKGSAAFRALDTAQFFDAHGRPAPAKLRLDFHLARESILMIFVRSPAMLGWGCRWSATGRTHRAGGGAALLQWAARARWAMRRSCRACGGRLRRGAQMQACDACARAPACGHSFAVRRTLAAGLLLSKEREVFEQLLLDRSPVTPHLVPLRLLCLASGGRLQNTRELREALASQPIA